MTRRVEVVASPVTDSLIGWAARQPFGPAYLGPTIVVVTRRTPAGQLLPALAMIDDERGGITDWAVYAPMDETELEALLAILPERRGDVVRRCEHSMAQAALFGAVDAARATGRRLVDGYPAQLFGHGDAIVGDPALVRSAGRQRPVAGVVLQLLG